MENGSTVYPAMIKYRDGLARYLTVGTSKSWPASIQGGTSPEGSSCEPPLGEGALEGGPGQITRCPLDDFNRVTTPVRRS